MGIFIHLKISKAVKKEEWDKVYEETLQLVSAFPLADMTTVKCRGIDTLCLVPAKEREYKYGWNKEKTRICWRAVGDYETMNTAEEYSLSKDLVLEEDYEADAGDAMMGVLPCYLNYDFDDPKCNHTHDIWGCKTQGEPYHIYLLAIACLIESRLGDRAFVYGDITRGQCERAVELANKYLTKPINIPHRCDMEKLRERVSKLPLTDEEKLEVFVTFFLGAKKSEFGKYIRTMYSEKTCDDYWLKKFKDSRIGTIGFDEELKEYLLWGFSLEKLCDFVDYNDKDHIPQYENFVKEIMDTKMHWKEKNCDDVLEINQDEDEPYTINTLMAQFVFAGARNKKVDRYIPIEEIRMVLKKKLEGKCDVDRVINQYLKKETELEAAKKSAKQMNEQQLEEYCKQEASELLTKAMNTKRQVIREYWEKYDVSDYEDFMYYEKGDTIHPQLLESLQKSFEFYHSLTTEKRYEELIEKSVIERYKWLVEHNKTILIRDKDWNKIFSDMEENKTAFARYYPMVRVEINSDNLDYLVKSIVLNDELYDFCRSFNSASV